LVWLCYLIGVGVVWSLFPSSSLIVCLNICMESVHWVQRDGGGKTKRQICKQPMREEEGNNDQTTPTPIK